MLAFPQKMVKAAGAAKTRKIFINAAKKAVMLLHCSAKSHKYVSGHSISGDISNLRVFKEDWENFQHFFVSKILKNNTLLRLEANIYF